MNIIISDADAQLGKSDFSMSEVARLINAAGVFAYVEQTGGGCATIYAGGKHIDEDGAERYAIAAGPGTFDGVDGSESTANLGGFSIGPDSCEDDTGTTVDAADEGLTTIAAIAAYIVKAAR